MPLFTLCQRGLAPCVLDFARTSGISQQLHVPALCNDFSNHEHITAKRFRHFFATGGRTIIVFASIAARLRTRRARKGMTGVGIFWDAENVRVPTIFSAGLAAKRNSMCHFRIWFIDRAPVLLRQPQTFRTES